MKVRGAPAIAIVAALSLAVEIHKLNNQTESARSVRDFVWERLEYLKTSRPTAVNLGDAVGKLKIVAEKAEKAEKTGGSDGGTVASSYIAAAERMLVDDVKDNEAIGKHGAIWIKEHTKAGMRRGQGDGDLKVITHCNTGSVDCAALSS